MEMRVFISYAREDYQHAKRLFDSLMKQSGIIPWLDKENILPGMDWEHEVMQAIQDSRFFIPLLSEKSVSKTGVVQREMKEGLKRLSLFPPSSIFLIPARLDNSKPSIQELKRLNWVDMFPDWDSGVRKIIAAINHEIIATTQRPIDSLRAISAFIGREKPPSWNRMSRTMVIDYLRDKKNLRGINLMEENLGGLDFSNCDLRGANLVATDLSGSNLSGTLMSGANCERAVLIETNIKNSDMWGVNFWRATLFNSKGWNEIKSLEHANFYETSGITEKASIIKKFKTTKLWDYGSFFDYFRTDLGMTTIEIERTFLWVNHEYFRSVLEHVY
jgi:hypothetical protein